jgi:hypothetical protein
MKAPMWQSTVNTVWSQPFRLDPHGTAFFWTQSAVGCRKDRGNYPAPYFYVVNLKLD